LYLYITNNMKLTSVVCLLFLLLNIHSLYCDDNFDLEVHGPNEIINGVSPATRRYWMNQARLIQQDASLSPCPFGAFGALAVNRTDNTLACYDPGFPNFNDDPSSHGEIQTIRDCASRYPGNRFNSAFWQQLSLYTTGESCPMCESAIRWANFGEVIWGTSIPTLVDDGWPQIHIRSHYINEHAQDAGPATIEIAFVLQDLTDPEFAFQFNSNANCPTGCTKSAGSCVPTNSNYGNCKADIWTMLPVTTLPPCTIAKK